MAHNKSCWRKRPLRLPRPIRKDSISTDCQWIVPPVILLSSFIQFCLCSSVFLCTECVFVSSQYDPAQCSNYCTMLVPCFNCPAGAATRYIVSFLAKALCVQFSTIQNSGDAAPLFTFDVKWKLIRQLHATVALPSAKIFQHLLAIRLGGSQNLFRNNNNSNHYTVDLWQVDSLFQSEFSTACHLVLPLSISCILPFP